MSDLFSAITPAAIIKTASWFAKLPPDHLRICISRGVPRGQPVGSFKRLVALQPGSWFKSVDPAAYLELYNQQLARLDPEQLFDDLHELAGEGRTPVMVCWEHARDIAAGKCWCHRHIASAFLEGTLGIAIAEVGHEGCEFDRWRYLRERSITPPSYPAA